jgi:hypothetical protein
LTLIIIVVVLIFRNPLHPIFAFSFSILVFYIIPYYFYSRGTYINDINEEVVFVCAASWFAFSTGFFLNWIISKRSQTLRKRKFGLDDKVLILYGTVLAGLNFFLVDVAYISQILVYLNFLFASVIAFHIKGSVYVDRFLLLTFFLILILVAISGDKSNVLMMLLPFLLRTNIEIKFILRYLIFTCLILLVFVLSGLMRDHPLVAYKYSFYELAVLLVIGRLNMVEPFKRALDNPGGFQEIMNLYPLNNTIFPNMFLSIFPAELIGRQNVSPAIMFSEKVYHGADTNVSMSSFAEVFLNFGYVGLLVYFSILGALSGIFFRYARKTSSFLLFSCYLFFLTFCLYLNVERYQALMWSHFFKFSILCAIFYGTFILTPKSRV